MTHTQEWHDERRKGIGGSDATKIMAGDWLPLWEEKTGRREPEDLSWVLPVQIGVVTEDLNRRWFAHVSGNTVTEDSRESLVGAIHFMRCNLDGRVSDGGILECKHVNPFAKEDEVVNRYYPQLQHNMIVSGARHCYLSIFFGTQKHEWFRVEHDPAYADTLIQKETDFWFHVEKDIPPPSQDVVATDIALDDMREVDMIGHNEWASSAADWLENKGPARTFQTADKALKGLVENDVKLAFGHGVHIKRAKNGSMRIGEEK